MARLGVSRWGAALWCPPKAHCRPGATLTCSRRRRPSPPSLLYRLVTHYLKNLKYNLTIFQVGRCSKKCRTKAVVYQAVIASANKTWNYIGMTSRSFHDRWLEHKNDKRAGTALSGKVRELWKAGKPVKIQIEIIRVAHVYKTRDSQCDLCLTKKTCIALHNMAPRKLRILPA